MIRWRDNLENHYGPGFTHTQRDGGDVCPTGLAGSAVAATIVNGRVAIENGEATGDFAGQVLKGPLASSTERHGSRMSRLVIPTD